MWPSIWTANRRNFGYSTEDIPSQSIFHFFSIRCPQLDEKVKGVKEGMMWPLPEEKVRAREGRTLNLNSCRNQWWNPGWIFANWQILNFHRKGQDNLAGKKLLPNSNEFLIFSHVGITLNYLDKFNLMQCQQNEQLPWDKFILGMTACWTAFASGIGFTQLSFKLLFWTITSWDIWIK